MKTTSLILHHGPTPRLDSIICMVLSAAGLVLALIACLFAYQSWCGIYIEEANRSELGRGAHHSSP